MPWSSSFLEFRGGGATPQEEAMGRRRLHQRAGGVGGAGHFGQTDGCGLIQDTRPASASGLDHQCCCASQQLSRTTHQAISCPCGRARGKISSSSTPHRLKRPSSGSFFFATFHHGSYPMATPGRLGSGFEPGWLGSGLEPGRVAGQSGVAGGLWPGSWSRLARAWKSVAGMGARRWVAWWIRWLGGLGPGIWWFGLQADLDDGPPCWYCGLEPGWCEAEGFAGRRSGLA